MFDYSINQKRNERIIVEAFQMAVLIAQEESCFVPWYFDSNLARAAELSGLPGFWELNISEGEYFLGTSRTCTGSDETLPGISLYKRCADEECDICVASVHFPYYSRWWRNLDVTPLVTSKLLMETETPTEMWERKLGAV
jgi:hypothetical protein